MTLLLTQLHQTNLLQIRASCSFHFINDSFFSLARGQPDESSFLPCPCSVSGQMATPQTTLNFTGVAVIRLSLGWRGSSSHSSPSWSTGSFRGMWSLPQVSPTHLTLPGVPLAAGEGPLPRAMPSSWLRALSHLKKHHHQQSIILGTLPLYLKGSIASIGRKARLTSRCSLQLIIEKSKV